MWPMRANKIYELIQGNLCPNKKFEEMIISGVSTDSRLIRAGQMFVAIKGEKYDGHEYLKTCFAQGASLALVQKNLAVFDDLSDEEKERCLVVPNVVECLRVLAAKIRQDFPFPVIGIGGSNGKTTTKEILFSMLQGYDNKVTKTNKSENGYLGVPLTILQEAHESTFPPKALVLEIGIDEIGAMEKHVQVGKPNIVTLTALGPEHLTGLKNWETAIKEELLLFSDPLSTKVWQWYDPHVRSHFLTCLQDGSLKSCKNVVVVEKKDYESYLNSMIKYQPLPQKIDVIWNTPQENSIPLDVNIEINSSLHLQPVQHTYQLHLPGKHNVANFALAYGSALACGMKDEEIAEGFSKFVPPPMRSNLVTLPNGAILMDDCYNASPFSMQAALKIFENPAYIDKPKLLVLGDMLELDAESKYWHESLVPMLNKLKHAHLCLYGPAMYSCYKLLQDTKDTFLKDFGSRVFWLDSEEDPAKFFAELSVSLPNSIILVKASRGLRLERFVKILEAKCK